MKDFGMEDLFEHRPIRPVEPALPPPLEAPELPPGIPPEVCMLFEKLALRISEQGFKRYSSDAILHRIRWHYHIERGMRDFKCNDHWTAVLARWFLTRHPHMAGFFELRKSPHSEDGDC